MPNYHDDWIIDSQSNQLIKNPDYIPGCKHTKLIQRLGRPQKFASPFSFGGGLHHGGLSDEAWEIISKLCNFEYMGAAEFEFGSLPKAFQKLVESMKKNDLEGYCFSVIGQPALSIDTLPYREYGYEQISRVERGNTLEATLFVLAPKTIRKHVEEVILSLSISDDSMRLQEPTNLRETIFSCPEWEGMSKDEWKRRKTCGWLELDNGFMFFSQEEMWRNFCELFGVSIPSKDDLLIVTPAFSVVSEQLAKLQTRMK